MADMHSLFLKFNDNITLSTKKADSLKTSRDAIRKDIKTWFSDNDKNLPKFCWQGSFSMKTTVNPLDDDYDMDDGVYLQGYEEEKLNDCPAVSTVHDWVKSAVDDRTLCNTVDKNTCVRVKYANKYHIDLPIYIVKEGKAYLAHKSKGWTLSDPKAFTDWFIDEVKMNSEQLRRLVKYLKAWKDYNHIPLKGIEITILVVGSFSDYDGRDEISLKNTVQGISDALHTSFSCTKPVDPYEDLFENKTENQQRDIKNSLQRLIKSLDSAVKADDEYEGSVVLRKEFGSRFPLGKKSNSSDEDNRYERTSAPGILKHDGRSA